MRKYLFSFNTKIWSLRKLDYTPYLNLLSVQKCWKMIFTISVQPTKNLDEWLKTFDIA